MAKKKSVTIPARTTASLMEVLFSSQEAQKIFGAVVEMSGLEGSIQIQGSFVISEVDEETNDSDTVSE